MPYPSQIEIDAEAAAAGFVVGAYVHMKTRDYTVAGAIREFSYCDGEVVAVWMNGACRTPLHEICLSTGHRTREQFPSGYDFIVCPQLIAQALINAGSRTPAVGYTAVQVKSGCTEQVETWATTAPEPSSSAAVFMRIAAS